MFFSYFKHVFASSINITASWKTFCSTEIIIFCDKLVCTSTWAQFVLWYRITPNTDTFTWAYFRTNELTVNEKQRARAGLDFESIVNSNYALIKNGSSYGSVSITILSDLIPELGEIFEILLTGVEVVGYDPTEEIRPKVDGITRMNVTIQENDYPYGLFALRVEREQVLQSNSQYFVYEPDESRIPITFYITRGKGNIN